MIELAISVKDQLHNAIEFKLRWCVGRTLFSVRSFHNYESLESGILSIHSSMLLSSISSVFQAWMFSGLDVRKLAY